MPGTTLWITPDIHVLLRKDLSKLPAHAEYMRDDGDYPVAWTKMYGKSRVFASTIGDGAEMWDDPMIVKCTTRRSNGRWGRPSTM